MLVYPSCLFTCQLRDLSPNFTSRTPPPQITGFFFRTVKKILITTISENSSFLAKSLLSPTNIWGAKLNAAWKNALAYKHMRRQVERRLEECSRLQTYQAQSWTPLGRMLSPTNIWGAKLNALGRMLSATNISGAKLNGAWKNALAYKHMRRQVERCLEECSRLQTYEAPSWMALGRMLSPTNIWGAKLNAAWKNALAYKDTINYTAIYWLWILWSTIPHIIVPLLYNASPGGLPVNTAMLC